MKFIRTVVEEGGKIPTKSTEGSAGYDMYATGDFMLYPDDHLMVDLKVRMELPAGICGILSHRSGMNSKKGISAYGLIDPDYRGSIKVTLFNHSGSPFFAKKGDRIAQLRLAEVPQCRLLEAEDIEETERGDKGHGSSGR